MFKQITTVSALMISAFTFSQVGIETETPQATLDVVGKPTDNSVLDGIIAPRLEGAQLRAKTYTSSQTGALVYVTAADTAPAGQTIDVTAEGYYYFNGTKWVIAGSGDMVNIYNADGTLTGERTMTMNSNLLRFSGTDGTIRMDNDGESEFYVQSINSTDARVRLTAGSADLQIRASSNGSIDFSGQPGGTNSMNIGTSTDASPLSKLEFYTVGSTRMTIDGIGNVGINTNNPTERFHTNGNVRLQSLPLNGAVNAIFTMPNGSASATQNQTFTATKTVVADENGVLGYVTGLPAASQNIYNVNGSLTANRTLTNDGFDLTFLGTNQSTSFSATGGLTQTGLGASNKRASIILRSNDNNGNSVASNLQLFQDPESASQITSGGDSRSLNIGTTGNTLSAPITFMTSAGTNANGTEKMRITGIGNVGINANNPTERFDVNGITRLRGLPLNGSVNAIFTMPDGNSASATQNQTFTATRTLVSDANGVVGYVTGIPSDAGTSKVLVIANAPGTQNISGQVNPNAAIGQFTVEGLDTYNAWTSNVFTVPAAMGGIYIIVMQNSNTHTSTGAATPTWHTMAYYERSTNGGTNWTTMIKHTYADLAGTIVDNGNTLYWTGFLNAGDMIRVRFSCNATTDNIVNYGGLSITKLAQ